MKKLAVEFRLPIIDLSRTFNPYDKTHYGSTPIEPSNVSGQFIADLIAKARQRKKKGTMISILVVFRFLWYSSPSVHKQPGNARRQLHSHYLKPLNHARPEPISFGWRTSLIGEENRHTDVFRRSA